MLSLVFTCLEAVGELYSSVPGGACSFGIMMFCITACLLVSMVFDGSLDCSSSICMGDSEGNDSGDGSAVTEADPDIESDLTKERPSLALRADFNFPKDMVGS